MLRLTPASEVVEDDDGAWSKQDGDVEEEEGEGADHGDDDARAAPS
jgi:hypothetical protein